MMKFLNKIACLAIVAVSLFSCAEEKEESERSIHERILDEGSLISGLANGLAGVKAGERCDIVFSAKYGFGNTVVYNVPKLTPLFFEVWIEGIVKN